VSPKAHVLFSCRDPGGVGHILTLLDGFRHDGRFTVSLAASDPALSLLRQKGESGHAFVFANGCDHLKIDDDPNPLLDAARRLLRKTCPDAVCVCLSSLGVGIDEALLATTPVPSFAMQDFWGDVNLGLGVPASTYFVIDEYAARITHERWDVRTLVVGSPKHVNYKSLNVDKLRKDTRTYLGVHSDQRVIGFFGQSSHIPGHEMAFEDLARAASAMADRCIFLLRDHSKFPADRHKHIARLKELGGRSIDVTFEGFAETWLAACDAAVTCFSSSALDHAYLSAYAKHPIGTVIYLFNNEEIQTFFSEVSGFPVFPTVEQGLGKLANDYVSLVSLLASAMEKKERKAYHLASKRLSKDFSMKGIINTVASEIGI